MMANRRSGIPSGTGLGGGTVSGRRPGDRCEGEIAATQALPAGAPKESLDSSRPQSAALLLIGLSSRGVCVMQNLLVIQNRLCSLLWSSPSLPSWFPRRPWIAAIPFTPDEVCRGPRCSRGWGSIHARGAPGERFTRMQPPCGELTHYPGTRAGQSIEKERGHSIKPEAHRRLPLPLGSPGCGTSWLRLVS